MFHSLWKIYQSVLVFLSRFHTVAILDSCDLSFNQLKGI